MKTENFLKGRRRHELSREERAALEDIMLDVQSVPARTTIVRRGDVLTQSTLLLSGMMCRYMDARDGQRQLLGMHVAGDFVDLHGYPLQRLDHDVATISAVEIATVPHAKITTLIEKFPHLGRLLWFSTMLDAAVHREWIFRLGRLDALGRVAHFLSELHARLEVVGKATGGRFDFPLTQQDLGEACGLTNVHVNRTLRRLREDGLVTIGDRVATIHDRVALATIGEFSPDYLYLANGERTP